ncbi:agglutinin-2-like [Salvia miltiorrhiza]|uniref:agglutinin-2-like n=1 Tax=Salvia miltiorrhiza TaxID=226208 RepID=UPI0025AD1B32|nr:agglutinin-2-like [Salvia miltiorrhiza]
MATSLPQTLISFEYDFYKKPWNFNSIGLEGDAHYLNDTNCIRLTKTDKSGKALQHSAGRAVYLAPIKFWGDGMQMDLETTMKFIINPNSGDTDPGDGLTFFIEPVGAPMGSNGGSFGVFNPSGKKPNTFAIEFDIYVNTNDPSYRHVGIDFESTDSVVTMELGDALLGQEVTARIGYKAATSVISINVTIGSKTYEMSYVKDLSTVLTQEVQFGFSAATGDRVAVHDLIYWSFTGGEPVNTV